MADENYVRRWVSHCRKHNQHSNNIFYADDIVCRADTSGVDITLFATTKHTRDQLDDAVIAIKMQRDVLNSLILLVPDSWLEVLEQVA